MSEDDAETSAAPAPAADAAAPDSAEGLAHPARPTAWDTRTLVTTAPQPPPQRIVDCIEQVTALTKDAGTAQDLRAAAIAAAALVAKDPVLYHACFYQMMVRLDDRLAVGGAVMDELADIFLASMRSLWVLAGALDAHADGHRYFRYLRTRYVQLSADVFGRDVSVVGPPVGSLRSQAPRPATTPANGAGRSAKPATAAAD